MGSNPFFWIGYTLYLVLGFGYVQEIVYILYLVLVFLYILLCAKAAAAPTTATNRLASPYFIRSSPFYLAPSFFFILVSPFLVSND